MRRIRIPLLLLALAAAPGLHAQVAQGRVLEATSNEPVPGAIVSLMSPAGARAAATLTDSTGTYRVQAPAPGTYTLQVQRVGYESSTSAPVRLDAGQTAEVPLTADPRRVRLDPVVATGSPRQCGGELLDGSQAATLWEEARKALFSSTLAGESGRYRFVTETRERHVRLHRRRVLRQTTSRQTSVGLPFKPMAADSLVDGQYVVMTPRQVIVNGVDAYAILSDAFVEHHCFGLREGGRGKRGLVGLEFVPLANRVQPDVQGVLWIDRATAELRFVEYTYTGLRFRGPNERLSGRMDFARLPSGIWVTESWRLVAPMLELDEAGEPSSVRDMGDYWMWAVAERSARIVSVEAP